VYLTNNIKKNVPYVSFVGRLNMPLGPSKRRVKELN